MKTPRELGYTIPAEWEPVEAVWIGWPVEKKLWSSQNRASVQQHFASLVELLSRFTTVRFCVAETELDRVSALIPAAEGFPIATDDVWCRDHGATFLKNRTTGEVGAVDWTFTAWGGKFPYQKDAAVVAQLCETLAIPRFPSALVCEGGALESNGAGLLLTTESVLLNPNRNPGMSQQEVTRELIDQLGVAEVIWLPAGLDNDDTDGHIDMVARFVSERAVLAVEATTPTLKENLARLQQAGLEVETLPAVGEFADGVDGSYANFLIANDGIIVPQYNLATDQEALAIIRNAFPRHEVVPCDCTLIGLEGGAVHCLTQGQWRAEKSS